MRMREGSFGGRACFVEGHDVEKTGMSVDEMVSKEGKDSDGNSFTPLQSAARNEQLEIAQYLVKVVLQWTSLDRRIVNNSLHIAAY